MRTREEHLKWCKERALEELQKTGDAGKVYASMTSDLNKHSETKNHMAIEMGIMLLFSGNLDNPYQMKNFIEGFN
jgi:hypothetical protein